MLNVVWFQNKLIRNPLPKLSIKKWQNRFRSTKRHHDDIKTTDKEKNLKSIFSIILIASSKKNRISTIFSDFSITFHVRFMISLNSGYYNDEKLLIIF
jgi:hypothetical protein